MCRAVGDEDPRRKSAVCSRTGRGRAYPGLLRSRGSPGGALQGVEGFRAARAPVAARKRGGRGSPAAQGSSAPTPEARRGLGFSGWRRGGDGAQGGAAGVKKGAERGLRRDRDPGELAGDPGRGCAERGREGGERGLTRGPSSSAGARCAGCGVDAAPTGGAGRSGGRGARGAGEAGRVG